MTAQDCFRNEPLCPRHLAPIAFDYGFLAPKVTSNVDLVPEEYALPPQPRRVFLRRMERIVQQRLFAFYLPALR
jgi:hypothetical protein